MLHIRRVPERSEGNLGLRRGLVELCSREELQKGDSVIENENYPTIDDVEPIEQVDGELQLPPY